jgi:uncharacterized coiled-coil protein SlyX
MEQYEKSGPQQKTKSVDTKDPSIRHLEEQLAAQAKQIQELQKEIRQLRSRLDRHADHLNRQSRG